MDDEDDFDNSDVVLMRYTVDIHGQDTDDIVIGLSPENYDHHHSARWNQVVNEKALELEQQMKVEENQEAIREKSRQDGIMRAA
jgi:hypothetical protein